MHRRNFRRRAAQCIRRACGTMRRAERFNSVGKRIVRCVDCHAASKTCGQYGRNTSNDTHTVDVTSQSCNRCPTRGTREDLNFCSKRGFVCSLVLNWLRPHPPALAHMHGSHHMHKVRAFAFDRQPPELRTDATL